MRIEEVAQELCLTRTRVHQIESRAIKRLREAPFRNELIEAFNIALELKKLKAQNDSANAEMRLRIIKGFVRIPKNKF